MTGIERQSPAISVGMPVYNGETYLEASIASVLAQTFDDFEVVISDNASTDRTQEICQDLTATEPRIRYLRSDENQGAARNYNIVFHESNAPYFRWHNADDLITPDYHQLCYDAIRDREDVALVYGGTELIDAGGQRIGTNDENLSLCQDSVSERFRAYYLQVGLCNVIYGLMRRTAMLRGPLFGDGTLPAADIRFMGELSLQGKFLELPQQGFFRRMHDQSSSADRSNDTVQQQFWSAGKHDFKHALLRLSLAYFKSFAQAPTSARDRLALYLFWLGRMYAQKRLIWDEIFNSRHASAT